MQLDQFILNTLNSAYRSGLADGKVFSVIVLGPSVDFSKPFQKRVTVSFTSPQLVEGQDPEELWLNPTTTKLYRMYSSWTEVLDYDEIFFKRTISSGESPFVGDTAAVPIYVMGDPSADTQVVNKHYVDSAITAALTKIAFTNAVATVADLRNMNVATISDKTLIFVEETEKIYAYDLQAVEADDGINVIKPNVGNGRWKTTSSNNLDGGSF